MCEEEFSDSEDEGEGDRRNTASFKKAKRIKPEEKKEGEETEKKEVLNGSYFFPISQPNIHWFAIVLVFL